MTDFYVLRGKDTKVPDTSPHWAAALAKARTLDPTPDNPVFIELIEVIRLNEGEDGGAYRVTQWQFTDPSNIDGAKIDMPYGIEIGPRPDRLR